MTPIDAITVGERARRDLGDLTLDLSVAGVVRAFDADGRPADPEAIAEIARENSRRAAERRRLAGAA